MRREGGGGGGGGGLGVRVGGGKLPVFGEVNECGWGGFVGEVGGKVFAVTSATYAFVMQHGWTSLGDTEAVLLQCAP